MNTISTYAHNIASIDWKKEAKVNLIPSATGLFMGAIVGTLDPVAHAGFAASYFARRAFNTFGIRPLETANAHLMGKIQQHFPSAKMATLAERRIYDLTLYYVAPYVVGYSASLAVGYDISIPGLLLRSLLAGYVFEIVKGALQDDPFKNSDVLSIDGSNFQKEVLESELPVLVDVYGSACPPCRTMAPIFSELSGELKGRVKCAKFNISNDSKLAKQLNIEGVPTFLFFKDGIRIDTVVGAISKEAFANRINNAFINN